MPTEEKAERGEGGDDPVRRAAVPDGGDHAEGNAHQRREADGDQRLLQGGNHMGADDLQHGPFHEEAGPPVAAEEPADPAQILQGQGIVEAQGLSQLGDLFRAGLVAQNGGGGVAGDQVDQQEDGERHHKQDRNQRQEPLQEVFMHGKTSPFAKIRFTISQNRTGFNPQIPPRKGRD